MIRLVKIELFKLATVRVGYGLLATSAALTALFTSLEASRSGNGESGVAALSTASGLSTVTTTTGWSMLFAGVLGVIVAAGEFHHATATLTFLGNPQRSRVAIAKSSASATAGAAFGLVSGLIATCIGLSFAAGRGYVIALGAGTLTAHVAGAALGGALFGAVGAGVGSLVRSQLAGVIGIFVWGLVIESVVGGLLTSVRPYLPYTAATT